MASSKRNRQRNSRHQPGQSRVLPQPIPKRRPAPQEVSGAEYSSSFETYNHPRVFKIGAIGMLTFVLRNNLREAGVQIPGPEILNVINHSASAAFGSLVTAVASVPVGNALSRMNSFNATPGRLRAGLVVAGAAVGTAFGVAVESTAGSEFIVNHLGYDSATSDVVDVAYTALGGMIGTYAQGIRPTPVEQSTS